VILIDPTNKLQLKKFIVEDFITLPILFHNNSTQCKGVYMLLHKHTQEKKQREVLVKMNRFLC